MIVDVARFCLVYTKSLAIALVLVNEIFVLSPVATLLAILSRT